MLPPLSSLRCFYIASRSENFSVAADILCVTPSAVSHQIKMLERFFRRPLFVRAQNKMKLTDSGRIYAEQVATIFAELEHVTQAFIDSSESVRLVVRVPSSLAGAWLIPRLAGFVHIHPEIEIQIVTEHIASEQAPQCEIRYGHGRWPNTQAELLWTEKLQVLAAPAGPSVSHLDELGAVPLIHTRSRVHGWADVFRKYDLQLKRPAPGIHFDKTALALEAAKAGLGLALESPLLAQRLIRDGLLRRTLDTVEIEDEAYYFVHDQRPESAAMRLFKGWLREQLASVPAAGVGDGLAGDAQAGSAARRNIKQASQPR